MATEIQKVRLLIPDVEAVYDGDTLFSDEDISGYLEIASDSVLIAAAFAVRAMATSEAIISKVIRTQDLQTNGPAVAKAMHEHADALEKRANLQENFFFGMVSFAQSPSVEELTEFWNGVDGIWNISPDINPATYFDGGTG